MKSISINHIEKLESWLKKNGIERRDICLVGSCSLAALGLRDNHDLEFIVRPLIRKKLSSIIKHDYLWLTYNIEVDDKVELWKNQLLRIGITDKKVFSKHLFDSIDGYNILYLDIERMYKNELGRKKDKEDIKMIDAFSHEIKYRKSILNVIFSRLFYIFQMSEWYIYSVLKKIKFVGTGRTHVYLW